MPSGRAIVAAMRSGGSSVSASETTASTPRRSFSQASVGVVGVDDLELVAEDLAERPVGEAGAVGGAAPDPEGRLLRPRAGLHRQLAQQARLADPGLADHGDQVRAAFAAHPVEQRHEQRRLVLAADQRRLGAGAAGGRAGIRTRAASQAGTGSDLPFRVSGSSSEYSIAPRVRRWVISPTVTLPGSRRRLEPGGDVDRVAHHRVAVADLAGQHLAGVDPDPQREVDVGRLRGDPRHVLVDLLHRGLHRQAGAHRALRVVLVGDGGAEDRHHVVADVLVHAAAVADDLLSEASQRPVHDRLHGLGVHALGDRRVAGQVGEQDRCLAALLRQRAGAWRPQPARPHREAGRRTAPRAGRDGGAPGPLHRAGRGAGGPPAAPAPPRPSRRPRAPCHTRCRTSRAGGFSAPQLGQLGDSVAPHDMQNRALSGFSVPQLGQAPPPT